MTKTFILGISALDKEAAVTLFADSEPVYCVAEERLTRRKQQDGFPSRAIDEALAYANLQPGDLAAVAYPFNSAARELTACLRQFPRHIFLSLHDGIASAGIPTFVAGLIANWRCHQWCDNELSAGLERYRLRDKLRRFDHEMCHAAAAFYSSGYETALVQISDWYGTGSSGGIYLCQEKEIQQLVCYRYPNSLGGYFACFTELLGFVPDLEEGKVVGLAAYGDASRVFPELIDDFRFESDGSFRLQRPFEADRVKQLISRHGSANVAAGLQSALETVLVASLVTQLKRTGIRNVCLAGGSMANVKANQRIQELQCVDSVYVFPAMGDGGSGYGAACLALSALGIEPRRRLENVFLSRECDQAEILEAVSSSGCISEFCEDIDVVVARLLAKGYIVARCRGRMEFGPRALGNRSILANPSRPGIGIELNRRLKRAEIMPFAPATTKELADGFGVAGLAANRRSAAFMTMTFDIPPAVARTIPAAVHVDESARLQVVAAEQNPTFHRIIAEFHALTGTPAVLNTSFNSHGEPIVYTPADAIRTFRNADLDYLALGSFLLSRNGLQANTAIQTIARFSTRP